jgi:hypothetical protein
MQRNTILGVVTLGVLLGAAATVIFAHHSMSAKYDIGKTITIEGTMTEVAWGNPHTWLFVDAKPVGQPDAPVRNWVIEAPGATGMVRAGWQKDSVQVGYKVKLIGYPHKQGKAEMVLVELSDDRGHDFKVAVRLPYAEAGTPGRSARPE